VSRTIRNPAVPATRAAAAQAGGRPGLRSGPRSSPLLATGMVNGVLVLGAVYMLFPLVWLVTAAGKGLTELYTTSMFDFGNVRFAENLQALAAAQDGIFLRWYLNSIVYAGGGALLGALVCVMAGYAFDKYRFRGREALFGVVLAGVLVPGTALSIPLYLLASRLGVVNTVWAVFIPFLTFPFGVYLARVFSQGYIPDEVLEAARVDGAGELRAFSAIGLRLMLPGFVTIFLFQFVSIWNNFFLPLVMLSDTRLFPLSLGLYIWNSRTQAFPEFYPLVIGGSLMSVLPLIVSVIVLQRFWRSGLTAGSIK
jgi:multiple sugar transport system permease protein